MKKWDVFEKGKKKGRIVGRRWLKGKRCEPSLEVSVAFAPHRVEGEKTGEEQTQEKRKRGRRGGMLC